MKHYKLSKLMATLCALPTLCSAIVIGDFEGSLDGWEASPPRASEVNLSTRLFGSTTGNRSLRVANTNTGYSWGTIRRNILNEPEILNTLAAAGSTVTIDIRARPWENTGSSLNLTLLVVGESSSLQMDTQAVTVNNTSQSMTFELTDAARALLASANNRAFIGFSCNSNATRVWFVDNIQALAPSSPPPPPAEGLDQYGGTLALSFNIPNNGFFRTHFHEGQWFLVTPENNAYCAFGLNHFHPTYWKRRGDRQDVNVGHWEGVFGVPEWQDEAWHDEFYALVKEMSDMVGANSLGYHNGEYQDLQDTREQLFPYFRHFVPVPYSFHLNPGPDDYPDVFSQDFEDHCNALAATEVAPYVNDENIIAWVCADVPFVTERNSSFGSNRYTWAMVLRNLPASADGKQEYVNLMQQRYATRGGFAEFSRVYDLPNRNPGINSWNQLRNAVDWRPRSDSTNDEEMEDQNAFNFLCIDRYYTVAKAAIRGVGANQLFAGDKLNSNVGNLGELSQLVDVASRHAELIVYQFFGDNTDIPNLQTRTEDAIVDGTRLAANRPNGRPIMNGDGGFGVDIAAVDSPQSPTAATHAQRAAWFITYAEEAFSNVHCVGYHVCGVIDSYNDFGVDKPGLMDPWGVLYMDEINALKAISDSLYHLKGIE